MKLKEGVELVKVGYMQRMAQIRNDKVGESLMKRGEIQQTNEAVYVFENQEMSENKRLQLEKHLECEQPEQPRHFAQVVEQDEADIVDFL